MKLFRKWIKKAKPTGKLMACVVSDVGCERSNNEDNYLLGVSFNKTSASHAQAQVKLSGRKAWHFVCVFDGMGGGEQGEVASAETAKAFQEIAKTIGYADKEQLDQAIRQAFLQANNAIVRLQQNARVYGTTATVLCTDGQQMKFYHLGDSRCYRLRDGLLEQLTKDQTLAQMKIDVGLYDETDPQAEAEKHKLTEYVGRDWTMENLRPVESQWMELLPQDRILLCSDGLYDMCDDEQICKILGEASGARQAATELTEAAKHSGGIDNITCAVMLHG